MLAGEAGCERTFYVQVKQSPVRAGGLVPRDPGVDMSPSVRKHDLLLAVCPMAMLSIFNLVPSGPRAIERM